MNQRSEFICHNCNKVIDGFYNWNEYAYRKGSDYFCSWKCYREFEQKIKKIKARKK